MRFPVPVRGLCLAFALSVAPLAWADTTIDAETITGFDKALEEAREASSDARKRLAVRRVIRDAQALVEANAEKPDRFLALEFLFRAQQQLIRLDDDAKHRADLMEISRELVKAPDDLAHLKFQADLLLSQAELAKQGASTEERAALRPLVDRYIGTKQGAQVLRVAMVMALELGDVKLVDDLREMIAVHYAADHEMINFQRDKLGGQVLGVPFVGHFKRSDGKTLRYPMDGLGRSLMVLFWSAENEGLDYAKGLAAASLKLKAEMDGCIEVISINVDGLPDAGESIIRKMGVDWQCLHLPDGRENPIYKAYVRTDPLRLGVSSSGQAALVMEGVGRVKTTADGSIDFDRTLGSALAGTWVKPDHCTHLCSLLAGDFLVFDPEGAIQAAMPPELKALGTKANPLQRTAQCVPEETLSAIQACFIAPPLRYTQTHGESLNHYNKAVDLCRKAIADHADAPDLWIVRNRLIVALMGLWKTNGQLTHFEQAVAESNAAMAAGYPAGCDLVARFCLAREALRQKGSDAGAILDGFVADGGGGNAPGPLYAAAAMLALDVADRARFETFREQIFQHHTENPMMWIMTSWMLDRHHSYWLFQVPFTAGWSYGRREAYFQSRGDAEPTDRILKAELRTADGKLLRIPEDLDTDYTAIFFAQPQPWSAKRDDGLPPSPSRTMEPIASFAAGRPAGDVKVALAVFGDKPAEMVLMNRQRKEVPCAMLALPGGLENPLVHRLGFLSVEREANCVLVDRQGHILAALSGLARKAGDTMVNVLARQDELKVNAMLQAGKADAAKQFILALAPPFDPAAVDERGRKLPVPTFQMAHLRARARVYMALKEWDKALADAEEVCQRQLGNDGSMSLRTDELVESEALRDSIKKQLEEAR